VASAVLVAFLDEALGAGAAVAAGEVWGVNVNHGFLAGDGDGDVAAAEDASFFLERFCLAGVGDAAAGDSAVAALAAGEAFFFLECFCLAAGLAEAPGLAAGVGVWPNTATAENAINTITKRKSLFITGEPKGCRIALSIFSFGRH
jgi:hypothetical protein